MCRFRLDFDQFHTLTYLIAILFLKVYTVCGIYLACACLAFFMIVFFLDKIQLDKDESRQGKVSMKLLVETFRHLYNSHYQKLLIPLTLYSGIEQAFIAGDFTKVGFCTVANKLLLNTRVKTSYRHNEFTYVILV